MSTLHMDSKIWVDILRAVLESDISIGNRISWVTSADGATQANSEWPLGHKRNLMNFCKILCIWSDKYQMFMFVTHTQ